MNVKPLSKHVLVRVPYTETELKYANSGIDLSMMSKANKDEIGAKIMYEHGNFFEIIDVADDVNDPNIKVGIWAKYRFPSEQFRPEIFEENGERAFNIPVGFLTAILKDANLYKQQRAEDALLKSIPAIEIAKA
jgi:hypothetical protein